MGGWRGIHPWTVAPWHVDEVSWVLTSLLDACVDVEPRFSILNSDK